METLELDGGGPVAWVWLNQPRRLNAIRQTTLDELSQVFEGLERNPAVRVVVLAARGPAFSSGFDVAWMAGLTTETLAKGSDEVRGLYDRIEACSRQAR